MARLRVGVADHLGWAVLVTADADHRVVDRRRVELVGPGLPPAPIHHEGGANEMHRHGPPLDDDALAALVASVRASAAGATRRALEGLAGALPDRVGSLSLRRWPVDVPDDIATLRRPPHESRADPVMYRTILAGAAADLGWTVLTYDGRRVEADARALLGDRAGPVLDGPRSVLGPPWSKDHRTALAATVVAG
jgi:hypothetical protein